MVKYIIVIISCILAFVAGVVVAKVVDNIPLFTLDTNVDIIAATALILSVIISVLLFRYFEKIKYSDQLRKNAVMNRLEECIKDLAHLEEAIGAQSIDHMDVIKMLRRCRRGFDGYATFATSLAAGAAEVNEAKYRLVCSELRELLTNTPIRGGLDSGIHIADGKIMLSSDRRVLIETQVEEAKGILYNIQKDVILSIV
jgi:hypothetical protein